MAGPRSLGPQAPQPLSEVLARVSWQESPKGILSQRPLCAPLGLNGGQHPGEGEEGPAGSGAPGPGNAEHSHPLPEAGLPGLAGYSQYGAWGFHTLGRRPPPSCPTWSQASDRGQGQDWEDRRLPGRQQLTWPQLSTLPSIPMVSCLPCGEVAISLWPSHLGVLPPQAGVGDMQEVDLSELDTQGPWISCSGDTHCCVTQLTPCTNPLDPEALATHPPGQLRVSHRGWR